MVLQDMNSLRSHSPRPAISADNGLTLKLHKQTQKPSPSRAPHAVHKDTDLGQQHRIRR
ncbi:hypothetical protein BC827DRAFT_1252574 [Russula dissimulans]|nr:hypothetical protein BC827DRAFT_1252574 [Russula dissimulans]